MNVNKMLRSLTAKQFMEWMAYARLDPFNELRQDYRIASIVQILANVNRAKHQKAYTLQDVLLKFEESEPEQQRPAWENSRDWAIIFAKAYNTSDT